MNPRLQDCVESYLAEELVEKKDAIMLSIQSLDNIDSSLLPENIHSKIRESKETALDIFQSFEDVNASQAVVDKATDSYSSLHADVRVIPREIRKIEKKIKRLTRERQIADDADALKHLEDEILSAESQTKKLTDSIPSDWQSISDKYQEKLKALTKAERKYRRAMDDSYEGISHAIKIISSGKSFELFRSEYEKLMISFEGLDNEAKQDAIKAISKSLGVCEVEVV